MRITKVLISLRGCAGWSAPMLFAKPWKTGFLATSPIYKQWRFRQAWVTTQSSLNLKLILVHTNEWCRLLLCLCLTSHKQLRSYGDGGQGLKSHPTDWWSRESNLRPLVYKASGLSTTQQRCRWKLRPKYTVKPILNAHLKRWPKIGFQDRLLLNAGQKYCRILQESILQYFQPSLRYHLPLRPKLFCLFLSCHLRQAILYILAWAFIYMPLSKLVILKSDFTLLWEKHLMCWLLYKRLINLKSMGHKFTLN